MEAPKSISMLVPSSLMCQDLQSAQAAVTAVYDISWLYLQQDPLIMAYGAKTFSLIDPSNKLASARNEWPPSGLPANFTSFSLPILRNPSVPGRAALILLTKDGVSATDISELHEAATRHNCQLICVYYDTSIEHEMKRVFARLYNAKVVLPGTTPNLQEQLAYRLHF